MAQLTIDIPDRLAEQLDLYLRTHPDATLAGLLDEALHVKLAPKDLSPLLALAGIVTEAPRGAADHAEDFDD